MTRLKIYTTDHLPDGSRRVTVDADQLEELMQKAKVKHYRSSVEDAPGQKTVYHAPCKASGTDRAEFAADLNSVTCLKCWTALKVKRGGRR